MNKLSEEAHLAPTFAISAVKGNILFSDIVEQSDTVVFDEDNFIKLIFHEDSVFYLKGSDFHTSLKAGKLNESYFDKLGLNYLSPDNYSKGVALKYVADFKPETFDSDIEDILSHIEGTILISDPSIRLNYKNSFTDSIEMTFNARGKRDNNTVDLNLAPFQITSPGSGKKDTADVFIINKLNSSLPEIASMLPEKIDFSGTATVTTSLVNSQFLQSRIYGSVEIEIPLEFRMQNLQFADTVDNFLDEDGDDAVSSQDFESLSVIINAKNEFPLAVSVEMSLFDSKEDSVISTVAANDIIHSAPVDSNGKTRINEVTETTTKIEFTEEFFNSIEKADKIIFTFTFNTTGNTSQNVKIYSDYKIDFTAAMVLKANINLK